RRLAESAEQEVLLDAELGKQSPSLGHHGDAQVDDLLGRQARQVMGFSIQVETDRAARGADHAHDAFHERALAVAVGAEQRHGFALLDSDRHAMARASSSLRSSTWESRFDGESAFSAIPICRRIAIASSQVSAVCSVRRCATYSSGTTRFSSTDMVLNGRGIWKLRAMPRRVRW